MEYHTYLMQFGKYIQYPLVILILCYSLLSLKKISFNDVLLGCCVLVAGFLSFFIVFLSDNVISNIKPVLIPLIFIVVLRSNSHRLLIPLLKLSLMAVLIEYIWHYSGLTDFSQYNSLLRLGIVRPQGLFLDLHVTSLFVASALYILGYRVLGGVAAVSFLSFQTTISYMAIIFRKKNKNLLFLFLPLVVLVMYIAGHLDPTSHTSALSILLGIVGGEMSFGEYNCYIYGCNTYEIFSADRNNTDRLASWVNELGFVTTAYFYGVPWLLFYLFLVFNSSKSYILPLMYFLTMIHYPVVFGILPTALLALSINYYNRELISRNSL